MVELLTGIFMVTYSAIFVSGWNFPFPSKSERILWNVSSLTILGFTSVGGLFFYYCDLYLLSESGARAIQNQNAQHYVFAAIQHI
jgi:hypothetical protein